MNLRASTVAGLLAFLAIAATSIEPVRAQEPPPAEFEGVFASGGVGVPELGHAEVGYFVLDRLSVEALYKWSFFNHLTGVGVKGYFWGVSRPDGPPRYAAFVGASGLINPTLGELQFSSRGDEIGAAAAAYVGFSLVSEEGLMFRAAGGPIFYEDPGFVVHPTFHIGGGWLF